MAQWPFCFDGKDIIQWPDLVNSRKPEINFRPEPEP
jgi:hypothetical protein